MGAKVLRLGWVRGPNLHGKVVTWGIFTWENVHLGSWRFSFMGKLPLGKLSFGKIYIWEVAALEIEHLGSCHLGKYPWEVAAWEKAFGKVPNTILKNYL